MSNVDLSKIRKGDKVVVEVEVYGPPRYNENYMSGLGGYCFSFLDDKLRSLVDLNCSRIIEHKPRELDVGDYVMTMGLNRTEAFGRIIAIHEGDAWVLLNDNVRATFRLSDLRRKD